MRDFFSFTSTVKERKMNGFYILMLRFMCYVDCLETLMLFGMSRMP